MAEEDVRRLRDPFGGRAEVVREGRGTHFVVHLPREEAPATVFFVHGTAACHAQFEDQIRETARRYEVVAMDAYGCGLNDAPDDWYGYAEDEIYTDWAALYGKYRKEGRPSIIVGHSFGTNIVARLATGPARDDCVGVVLIGPADNAPSGHGHPVFYLPVFVLNWLQPTMHEAFKSLAFAPGASEALQERESQRTSNAARMHMVKAFNRQAHWSHMRPSVAALHGSRAQVMVIAGEHDGLTPPAQARNVAAIARTGDADAAAEGEDGGEHGAEGEVGNTALHIVPNASHMVILEQPRVVTDLLTEFFARCVGGGHGRDGAAGAAGGGAEGSS